MLEVQRLHKSFGALVAVNDVSFDVAEGEIFGLLGPNGAGKTTAISMISGVLKPDSGRVLVDGRDIWLEPKKVKRSLGVVPQEIAVYEDLTARDNLDFWASLYGFSGRERTRRVNEALTRVGLSDRARDRVATFSGGMKRRLNMCMGLMHRPKLLLLDEPTVGIDPQARLNILDVIRNVASEGTAVLYTTHYMDEAEELCDRVGIIDHGSLLTVGTLAELSQLAGEGEVIRLSGDFDADTGRQRLDGIAGVTVHAVEPGAAVLLVQPDGPGLTGVLPELLAADLAVDGVSVQPPSLQSVFIRLTGRELRD